jgi:tetratricopeptide (TPR) repeat protein
MGYTMIGREVKREMETLLTEAKQYYMAGKFREAAELYRTITGTEPNNAYAHQGLAQCLNRLGQFEEAAEECRQALALNSGLAIPYTILGGSVYPRQRRYGESEAALKKATELDPACIEAHISLGATLSMQERFQEAIASLQKALALQPDSGIAHHNLSVVYARQKRHLDALKEASRAFQLEPSFKMAESWVLTALGCLAEHRALFFLFWLVILLPPYVTRSLLTAPLWVFIIWRITYGARSDLRSGRRARGITQLALGAISAVLYVYNLVYGLQLGLAR